MNMITMTQDEARMKLIPLVKNLKHTNKMKLLKLHFVTVILLVLSVALMASKTGYSSIGSGMNSTTAIIYVNLLAKFYRNYSIAKNALKRLEAGFEEELDYIDLYENYK